MDEELFWTPARQLRDLFARRSLSPLEFADATLARIERLDRDHHCFITIDREDVIAQARRAEEALGSPDRLGPLHGVPISIKDTIATAGLRTTFGSRVFQHVVPKEDAVAVARLRAAGAIIIGKTSTTEFALQGRTRNRLAPETVNPWRPGLTAGGSSGGAAASVALAMTAVAIGGDDGGSIRLPAALCGVYGLCPSAGRVPRLTVPPEGGHIGQVYQNTGPLSRDVGDAALVTRIIAGFHPSDPFSLRRTMRDDARFAPVAGRRALWLTFEGAAINSAVIDHVRAAAGMLGEIGVSVDDDGTVMDNGFETLGFLMRCHLTRYFRELAADPERRAMLTPESLGWAELCESRPIPIAEEVAAWKARGELVDRYASLFERYDLLLTPTFSEVAAPIPEGWESPVPVGQWAAATYGVNGTGLAAASVPCGFVDGLPVGLQIIAAAGHDDLVLDVSRAIEARWPWAGSRPAVTAVLSRS